MISHWIGDHNTIHIVYMYYNILFSVQDMLLSHLKWRTFQSFRISSMIFFPTENKHLKHNVISGIFSSTWRAMKCQEYQGDVRQQGAEYILGPGRNCSILLRLFLPLPSPQPCSQCDLTMEAVDNLQILNINIFSLKSY